ncbi:phospholipase D family protein [Pantoea sp. CFSAN033090]|uniref:phospholipase D family nuclease n=1 Tax=Pantoea sp. CFSAN033090 TaxID=1690502 RepID=UPI000690E1C3|nr:phospholipase D family protein [Pantoea sp. CFSAN033090]
MIRKMALTLALLTGAPCFFHSTSAVASAPVQVAFSPGNAESVIVDVIGGAQKSILMAAYSFTSRPVAQALLEAQKRGVHVYVVGDAEQASKSYSSFTYLANHKINVRLNADFQSMHNKFMVIDNALVQTGSFNYTAAATKKNAENIVVIDDRQAAQKFSAYWKAIYNTSSPLLPRY